MPNNSSPPKSGRKKRPRTKFHGAAYSLYEYFFAKYIKRGDIELHAEYELSAGPRRIDILIIKKKRGVIIDTLIGRIYRQYNIIEFKSPSDNVLTLEDFVKVVHVYAGGYAYKNNVMLTDMTATIVCYKRPTELFETLSKKFSYKILCEESGIYYINLDGVPLEKALRVQIVVCPELSDEYWELDALSRELRPEELPKFTELVDTKEGCELYGSDWGDTIAEISKELLKKEDKIVSKKIRMEIAKAWGVDKELLAKGKRAGRLEVISLLERGMSLVEAKRQLQLA